MKITNDDLRLAAMSRSGTTRIIVNSVSDLVDMWETEQYQIAPRDIPVGAISEIDLGPGKLASILNKLSDLKNRLRHIELARAKIRQMTRPKKEIKHE